MNDDKCIFEVYEKLSSSEKVAFLIATKQSGSHRMIAIQSEPWSDKMIRYHLCMRTTLFGTVDHGLIAVIGLRFGIDMMAK